MIKIKKKLANIEELDTTNGDWSDNKFKNTSDTTMTNMNMRG